MATIGSAFIEIGAKLEPFNRAMAQVDKKLKGLQESGKKLSDIGANVSLAISAPLAALGASIVTTAGNFEAGMNRVRAITGATGLEFEALEKKAKQMGATTQFSATEAAAGIETLARNGLKAADILNGALDASLALAAATGTDLANAADIATDAMAQFGLKAAQLPALADRITGATLNSKFSIDDMRLALAQAGGVAGKTGVEIEDFITAIAATSSAFSSGADAGTSFKTFLTQLAPQTKEATKLQQKLGLSFFDTSGAMLPLNKIAGQLQTAFAGLSEKQKIQAATTLFGQDAMRTALTLADTGAEKFDKLAQSIQKVSATQQAETRMQGFNGAMKSLQSAFEGLQIAIANSGILEFATKLANGLTSLLRSISNLNPKLLQIITIMGAIVAAAGPALLIFGKMQIVLARFGIALAPLALKIGLVVAAVTGLVIVAKAIYDSWEPVSAFFTRLWAQITNTIATGVANVISTIEPLLSAIGINMEGIKDTVANTILETNKTLASTPPVTFSAAVGSIADNIKSTFVSMKDTVTDAVAGTNASLASLGGAAPTTPTAPTMGGALGGMGAGMGEEINPIASLNTSLLEMPINAMTASEALTAGMSNVNTFLESTTERVSTLTSTWEMLNNKQFDFKKSLEGIAEGLAIQATQMGVNAKGLKDYGKQLLSTVKQNIAALIAEGVAAAVRGALTKVPFPANIAIAGIAGGAAAALFNSIIPSFAEGGIVKGETLARVGEYAGARNNPEVIAPLNKLQSMINTPAGGISKEDLNEAFSKQRITINSQIGMTEIVREGARTQYVARKGLFNV